MNDEAPKPDSSLPEALESIFAGAEAHAEEQAALRSERRKKFEAVVPTPQACIVAWVDLLGFRAQISNADTPEKFQAAYRRMRDVHEEFGKETASVYPDQAELNAAMGKRVIALSDGLVIALNVGKDSPDAKITPLYDRIGFFLEELRMAQARCASVGNFVRGGVALGYFWFEDDILLSPALVSAYEMESDKALAKNPVIILRRDLSEAIRALRTKAGYSKDFDPMDKLYRDCEWMAEKEKSEHVMLNFMPVFGYDDNPTPYLQRYCQRLIANREAAQQEGVKAKYEWLIEYAREFVRSEYADKESLIFGETTPPTA